jgi:NAD(P)-dependent dehydrogenase (short-subunit alcohol dehydrogenase family)
MELSGRSALVTGGASDIGAAIAAHLQDAGARVVIADREHCQIAVDLSQPGSARWMVAQAIEYLSGLDVLVNNAGGYSSRLIRRMTTGGRRSNSTSFL